MTAEYDIFPYGNVAITEFTGFIAKLCSFQATIFGAGVVESPRLFANWTS
jgi:hypothetical protein